VSAGVTLRAAGPDDAAALSRILVRTWRARYGGLVTDEVLAGLDEDGFADWFARVLMPASGHAATLAEVDGEPAGFIHIGPQEDEPTTGHVFSFYVVPPHSGQGIGPRLLSHALAQLAGEGYPAVTLWVFKDNASTVALYTRAGFQPDGAERVEPEYGVLEQRLRRELP
jgi:ribosomal protein S18 acetylase RimI-like enzyme